MTTLAELSNVIDLKSLLIAEHKRLNEFLCTQMPESINSAVDGFVSKIRRQAEAFRNTCCETIETNVRLVEEALKTLNLGGQIPESLNFPVHVQSMTIFRTNVETKMFKFDIEDLLNFSLSYTNTAVITNRTLPDELKPLNNYYRRTVANFHCEIKDLYEKVLNNHGLGDNLSLSMMPSPIDCKHLGFMLNYASDLRSLNLDGKKIGPQGMNFIATGLKNCTALELLNLRNNNIGLQGAASLSTALSNLTNIKSIYLTANSLQDEGISSLCSILPQLTNLIELSLSANMIDIKGAISLSSILASLTSLNSLNLSDNNLGKDGIRHLSRAFVLMPHLSKVFIGNNSCANEIQVHPKTKVLFY